MTIERAVTVLTQSLFHRDKPHREWTEEQYEAAQALVDNNDGSSAYDRGYLAGLLGDE